MPKKSSAWTLAETFTFENGQDVDRTVWQSPQWTQNNNASFLGQTAIRNIPDFGQPLGCVPVVDQAAQLQLSSYNPLSSPANSSFLGAQIGTIARWGLASYDGVAFEAKVNLPIAGGDAAPQGVVAALFAYHLIKPAHPFLHDEIDFEIASNDWAGSNPQINTNVYVVTDGTMQNYDEQVNTGISLAGSPVLRIEWTAAGVNWYINKDTNPTPFYTESNVPLSDMSLVLNFWVPASGWTWAYNSALLPSGAPGSLWTYQVEWAKVWTIPQS